MHIFICIDIYKYVCIYGSFHEYGDPIQISEHYSSYHDGSSFHLIFHFPYVILILGA